MLQDEAGDGVIVATFGPRAAELSAVLDQRPLLGDEETIRRLREVLPDELDPYAELILRALDSREK